MNLSDPTYDFALRDIAQLCAKQNLSPVFLEPETPPGPRRLYSNADYISQLIQTYGLQIQPSVFANWRPLAKASGYLPTIPDSVWILCTDGTVAWFVKWSGEILLGELTNFDGPKTFWAEDEPFERQAAQAEAHQARIDDLIADLLGD